MSVACINNFNVAFDRRKAEKPLSSRNEEKKVNISINIHPKAGMDESSRQEATSTTSRQIPLLKGERTPGKKSCELRPLGKSIVEGGHTRIVVEEEELRKFTQKFAHEKYMNEEKISYLERRLLEHERAEKEWAVKSKEYDQYLEAA
jgi:hypothetical protein